MDHYVDWYVFMFDMNTSKLGNLKENPSLSYKSGHKSPSLPTPCDLRMFRFMITFILSFLLGKAHLWQTSLKWRPRLHYRLLLGLLFWECTYPVALPYRWTSYIPPKYLHGTSRQKCIDATYDMHTKSKKTLFCLFGVISFTTQKNSIFCIY